MVKAEFMFFLIHNKNTQSGFSYLWVLMLVGLMGLMLAVAGDVYTVVAKREREKELMAIGRQFQEAIRRYRDFRSDDGQSEYPASMEDLLLDSRAPGKLRHLRKIFVDPMTRKPEWGIILKGGRVVGVHSLSTDPVLKKEGFDSDLMSLSNKSNYTEWLFVDAMAEKEAPSEGQDSGGATDTSVSATSIQ